MKNLPWVYSTIQMKLFPVLEEEIGERSGKMQEFIRVVELVKPFRFITSAMRWSELGRPMQSRENMLRAFFLKSIYNLATTKVLIENLRTNPSWRYLCGWKYRNQVPSEATFSRAFKEFFEAKILDRIHEAIIKEQYQNKIISHANIYSTAIYGRERRLVVKKLKSLKKKRNVDEKAKLKKKHSKTLN